MKKILRKSICLLAISIMLLASTAASFASTVSYEGQAEKFIFTPGSEYSPTDLFTNYKGVMPGDKLTQTVTVRNNASDKVNVEIFMRALGATDLTHEDGIAEVSQEASEAFLKQLTLTVTSESGSKLFEAPANETAQLTEWVSLGKFKSGAEVDLNVTLNVPLEMTSQEQIGALDWQFKVVETPVPQPPEKDSKTKTGDDMNLVLPVILIAAALAGMSAVLITKRRKNER